MKYPISPFALTPQQTTSILFLLRFSVAISVVAVVVVVVLFVFHCNKDNVFVLFFSCV